MQPYMVITVLGIVGLLRPLDTAVLTGVDQLCRCHTIASLHMQLFIMGCCPHNVVTIRLSAICTVTILHAAMRTIWLPSGRICRIAEYVILLLPFLMLIDLCSAAAHIRYHLCLLAGSLGNGSSHIRVGMSRLGRSAAFRYGRSRTLRYGRRCRYGLE